MKKLLVLLLCTTGIYAAPTIGPVTFKVTNNLDAKVAADWSIALLIKHVPQGKDDCKDKFAVILHGTTKEITPATYKSWGMTRECEVASIEIKLVKKKDTSNTSTIYTVGAEELDNIGLKGLTLRTKTFGTHTKGTFEFLVKGKGVVEVL